LKKHLHKEIFNHTGCLSYTAMQQYMEGVLSGAEKAAVEQHLNACLFCHDAMEGLGNATDHNKTTQTIKDIDSRVDDVVGKQVNIKRANIKHIDKTWMYISAAATVLLLVGFFTLYKLQEQPVDNMISEQIHGTEKDKSPATEDEATMQERTEEAVKKQKTDETAPVLAESMPAEEEEAVAPSPEISEPANKIAKPVTQKEDMMDEKRLLQDDIKEGVPEAKDEIVVEQDAAKEENQRIAVVGYGSTDKKSSTPKSMSRKTPTRSSPSSAHAFAEQKEIFYKLEELPHFRGGGESKFSQYVHKNIRYPEDAIENKKEGIVILEFTITHEGKVEQVEVIDGIYPSIDKEAVRVVSNSPDWSPGIQNGKPVDVRFVFPVVFSLND
jgi:periplasmic protein TonB